jgi:hypothetical protein
MAMSSGRRSERSGASMAYDHVRKLLPLKSGRVSTTFQLQTPHFALLRIQPRSTSRTAPIWSYLCRFSAYLTARRVHCIRTATVYALFTPQQWRNL